MLRRVLCLCFLLSPCFGANILGIVPTPSYSHQVVFYPIWKELSLRGHQVTLCTTNPINDPSLSNLTEIDWNFAYDIWNVKHNFSRLIKTMHEHFPIGKVMDMIFDTYDQELSHPKIKELIEGDHKFDLVILELFLPAMAAFSVKFSCPIIGISSLDASQYTHEILGNPTHPILFPNFMLPFAGGRMTFKQRLLSTLYYITERNRSQQSIYRADALIQKHFGANYPTLDDIWKNVSLVFINVNPILSFARPVVPTTIEIGGGIQLQTAKKLPEDIQSYLDNAKDGVIYFSLGTNAKSKDMPPETRQIIVETLGELPYKVLWKYEEDLPEKPKNIKIAKWLPQQDILRHPNVKVFVTQGGLQSMEEAIYSHVPMVGMPFFGDQPLNVKRMVAKGIGLFIDKNDLDKETFGNTILEVMNNPSYKKNIIELAALAQDQPMSGVEKAIWWTEYVLRHKGARHLRSSAVDVPLYQYFFIDIIALLLIIVTILAYIIYKIFKCCMRCCKKKKSKTATADTDDKKDK